MDTIEDIRGHGSAVGPAVASSRADTVAVIAAGLLWGTGGITGALLSARSGLEAPALAAYRLAIGGTLVVAVLACTGRLRGFRFTRVAIRRFVAVGALAAWFQSCYFAAVALTSVSLATLVTLGSAPVIVVIGECVITRTVPSGRTVVALTLAGSGLALLVGSPDARGAGVAAVGTLLAVGAGAGFAAITMLGSRPVPGAGPLPTVGFAFCAGGFALMPLAAAMGGVGVDVRPETLALLLYLGMGPTALAYVLYLRGLRSVAGGSAAVISLLEPLTAAVLGAVLLGDRLGGTGLAGGVCIAAAIVLASSRGFALRRSTRRRDRVHRRRVIPARPPGR